MLSRVWLILMVLAAACGGAVDSERPTTALPTSSSTSVGAASTNPPVTSTSAASESVSTTSTTAVTGTGHPRRATGNATVVVDGVEHEVEIFSCGWWIGPTNPQHPGDEYDGLVYSPQQGATPNFSLSAATLLDTGEIFGVGVQRRGDVQASGVSISWTDADDPRLVEANENNTLFASTVVIEGNRVFTPDPVRLRSSIDVFEAAEVTFDGTCETMGGAAETNARNQAEMLGLPWYLATGTITLGGVEYSISETDACIVLHGPDGAVVNGEGVSDGQWVRFELGSAPGFELLKFQIADGRVYQAHGSGELAVIGETSLSSNGTLTIFEALGDPAELAFDINCAE